MPRLSVTFNDDLYAAIDRLARAQGVTKSSVINEFLGASIPVMNNIAAIIEHLRTATDSEKKAFKDDLDSVGRLIGGDVENIKNILEGFVGQKTLRLV